MKMLQHTPVIQKWLQIILCKATGQELHILKTDLTMMFSSIWSFVDIDCNKLSNIIDCEFVHMRDIILDFIRSTVMLTAIWMPQH